jgi:choline dehydrogenase-like flavoprotein
MTIQDWGITYDELEPYYDKFEYTAAISGKAGNIKGAIQPGGNPFEAPRAREYPLPAADPDSCQRDVHQRGEERRLSPVPAPVGQRVARLHQSGRVEIRRMSILAAIASVSAARRTQRVRRTSR